MKRFLFFIILPMIIAGCDMFSVKEEVPKMMDFSASDIIGCWEIIEYTNTYDNGPIILPLNQNYIVFWENGRFESYGLYGSFTEGYWEIGDDGISIFAGSEDYGLIYPLSIQDGVMACVPEYPQSANPDVMKCRLMDFSEFCPGYGNKPVESFFSDESNVRAYLDAIYTEFNAFKPLLEGVRRKYNATVADSLLSSASYYSPEVDKLWKSVNLVLMRTNQGIDALANNTSLKQYTDNMLGLRAITAFRMAACWGSCATYWEHVSKESARNPLGTPIDVTLAAASRDLSTNSVYALTGAGYLTSDSVSSFRSEISSLHHEVAGTNEGFSSFTLKSWGFNSRSFNLSIPVLPVPISALEINMNLPQTPGWSY